MGPFSVIIATRNRAAALRETLRAIPADAEVIIVNNASTDLTPSAIRDSRPDAQVIRLDRDLGPAARQLALERASNDIVIALDDDCAPASPRVWAEMIRRMRARPTVGCAGFGVRRPSGAWECAALPRVFVGAAVAFRREALLAAGGYDPRLCAQSEEYGIVYRLAAAGWGCEVFHDLPAIHRRHVDDHRPARTLFLDARNNIAQAIKHLPSEWRAQYVRNWSKRYIALGNAGRAGLAARRGILAGHATNTLRSRQPLPMCVFEDLFCLPSVAPALRALQVAGVERVLFASLSKNIPMYTQAARWAGLRVAAIADNRFARAGIRWCDGLPVLTNEQALHEDYDAVVISDSAPIFAHQTSERWRRLTDRHVLAPDGLDPESFETATPTISLTVAA
jgi:GT2 family glycosyltransferase